MSKTAYEGREEMRIVPNVGAEARVRVRRAQALNDDIDWTLDEADERRALALWRPLAKQYPEDLAVLHGYVLALARCARHGDGDTAVVGEFHDAALRLLSRDEERWIAASFAGGALIEWAKRVGSPDALVRAIEVHEEAERRAKDATHAAYSLHHQAEALALLGRKEEAQARTARALQLAPDTRHMRFDVEW